MVAVTLLGLLAVTFLIGRVVPIDPVLAVVGDRAPAAVYARARAELGLDLPLYQQFWIYCTNALTGDFGRSVLTSNPVIEDIARFYPATIELATLGTIIGTVLGIPLGVFAAVRAGSLLDQIVRVIGLVGYSVPIFWLGLMALLLFYARLDWVAGPGRLDIAYDYLVTPITGMLLVDSLWQGEIDVFWNAFSHIILPAGLLGYFSLAYISRMTRSFMLGELSKEYITTARVKGISETRVIWWHALRNAAVPLVTVIVLSYANLLEGSVLTETVFAWPGLGSYLTNSLQNADMNAVLGGTLVIGASFVALNVLSDLLYRALDPRTR
ncbi:ABC transporter permease [Marinivivus vitaminiproducens]|uniref:ABC transporter permease n=1 Tax=Marinivivus vitaminiproducens TaxID=3035935 RepID=UPI0027A39B51|nr:ABC transporter permease [Geminicoccaceae bacterium SCSIO 64248]